MKKTIPADFTLLKRAKLGELKRGLYYATEWGNVRPSWHLECAAMALHHLGDTFDIVTGGANLLFPHHENVSAICQAATGKPLARYWLHSEPVLEVKNDGDDAAEPATIRRLLDSGVAGEDLRYLLLGTHYRKSLHLSAEALEGARRSRKRLDLFLDRLSRVRQGESWADLPEHLAKLAGDFIAALDDDLNIAAALAVLFNFQREINTRLDQGLLDEAGAQLILNQFREFDQVLGIMNFPGGGRGRRHRCQDSGPGNGPPAERFCRGRPPPPGAGRPGHRNPGHRHRPRLAP